MVNMDRKYFPLNKNSQITCEKQGKTYTFLRPVKNSDEPQIYGKTDKRPIEHTPSTKMGKKIFNAILKDVRKEYADEKDIATEDFGKADEIKCTEITEDKFYRLMEDLDKFVQPPKNIKLSEKEEKQRTIQLNRQYKLFESRRKEHGFTQLEYLCQIAKGLGVGDGLGIVKAYLTFLQTILGLKGTNLIVIGEQASGKTHMIEQALDMLPQETTHKGILTKSAFFKEFKNQNLDGHIFYLGDLGGVKDDEVTIEFRDVLKQLSTDGQVSRMITEEGVAITETVTGHPSICYTTVNDVIINEQEKSRSYIIMPPPVPSSKLMIFDDVMEAKGEFAPEWNRIQEDKQSVCGLTNHLLNTIDSVELYNPYSHVVGEFFKGMDNFNRKIKEFRTLLKIICILSDGKRIEHDMYKDKEGESYTSTLYIASKKDVLTAMHLFNDGVNMLPTEMALLKGLSEKFELVDPDETKKEVDEIKQVLFEFDGEVREPVFDRWDENKEFTIHTLKRYRDCRWYRNVKEKIGAKLQALAEKGYLIRKGKTTQNNVLYSIPTTIEENVTHIRPNWSPNLIQEGIDGFNERYPQYTEEFSNFMREDIKTQPQYIVGELGTCKIYKLPWER